MRRCSVARKNWDYGKHNWDKGDGLEVHKIKDNHKVSRYKSCMSMWDEDNIVMDHPEKSGSFLHVSIVKMLRLANKYKCRKMNGYKSKLNGR